MEDAIAARPWSLVINAAAYTAVDRAESDAAAAWRANASGPEFIARAAERRGASMIHLSTDYVFDGEKFEPYVEDDPVRPLGVYGASKEAGERAVRMWCPHHVILRTAWVVSPWRSNFVKTVLRLASNRQPLRIVDDQRGNPTSADDVADAVVAIGRALAEGRDACAGTFHFVNRGEATWRTLAEEVVASASWLGAERPKVIPITTAEYPTAARRPRDSRLACAKIEACFGIVARPWRDAIRDVVGRLTPNSLQPS